MPFSPSMTLPAPHLPVLLCPPLIRTAPERLARYLEEVEGQQHNLPAANNDGAFSNPPGTM